MPVSEQGASVTVTSPRRYVVEIVQTLTNALVVAFAAAVLGWMISGLRRETRQEIASLRAEVREEIQALRAEVREEIGTLRAEFREEIRALRSDLTQVALAVGARPRAGNE
jgi:hypothetical protein